MTTEPARDPFLVPVLEKLDSVARDELVALMGGWPVDPGTDTGDSADHVL